jgi:hypothetical protein
MKKLVMLGLPLLLCAGGAGAYMTGMLDPLLGVAQPAEEAVEAPPLPPTDTAFMDIRNLGIPVIEDGIVFQVVFLDLSLEVTQDAVPLVQRHRPLLLDRLQAALRDLFAYRHDRGMPPIDVAEMKRVVLAVANRLFGEGTAIDAHLISDWVISPGT